MEALASLTSDATRVGNRERLITVITGTSKNCLEKVIHNFHRKRVINMNKGCDLAFVEILKFRRQLQTLK